MRWSERRTAVRSTFEMTSTLPASDARSRRPSLILFFALTCFVVVNQNNDRRPGWFALGGVAGCATGVPTNLCSFFFPFFCRRARLPFARCLRLCDSRYSCCHRDVRASLFSIYHDRFCSSDAKTQPIAAADGEPSYCPVFT